jgi:hypothetical protein
MADVRAFDQSVTSLDSFFKKLPDTLITIFSFFVIRSITQALLTYAQVKPCRFN